MRALSTRVQGSSTPTNVPLVPIDPERRRALKRLAGRANEAISSRDQAILDAHYAGASYREIEAVTGINYVTVKRLIDRLKETEPATVDEHRAQALEEVSEEFARRASAQEDQP